MATAPVLIKDNSFNVTQNSKFSEDQISLLKRAICKGSTDDELKLFMHACERSGLDPFMRQIYFIKQKDGRMVIMTGIDGYRVLAERTRSYVPGKETVFSYDQNKNLVSATSYIKKMASDGSWHEIAATAFMSEYKANTPIWNAKPHVMLAKCSEALALRRAFPADLSGIYVKEEMDQVETFSEIQPIQKEEEQLEEDTITLFEVLEIENFINDHIHPHDPKYLEKALKAYKVDSLTKLKTSVAKRLRKNMAEKVALIASSNRLSALNQPTI